MTGRQQADQLAVAVAGAVKALDELGLVDAAHKADAVAKVGEVGQVSIAAGGVHLHGGTHHRHQLQVTRPAPQAAGKCHGSTLHPTPLLAPSQGLQSTDYMSRQPREGIQVRGL